MMAQLNSRREVASESKWRVTRLTIDGGADPVELSAGSSRLAVIMNLVKPAIKRRCPLELEVGSDGLDPAAIQ